MQFAVEEIPPMHTKREFEGATDVVHRTSVRGERAEKLVLPLEMFEARSWRYRPATHGQNLTTNFSFSFECTGITNKRSVILYVHAEGEQVKENLFVEGARVVR